MRDGVITGEGPTTKGRMHFSRALDAFDAAWCARILTATAVDDQPVSRAEAEALFEINDAAAERSDDGRFDDLLAKAVVHTRLPIRPAGAVAHRGTVPRNCDRELGVDECGRRQYRSAGMDREPDARQPRCNRTLMALVATIIGVATLPLATQLPNVFDIGM